MEYEYFVLELVESPSDIRKSIAVFNKTAKNQVKISTNLLRESKCFVYDSLTKTFGNSKFVGFSRLSIDEYKNLRENTRLVGILSDNCKSLAKDKRDGKLTEREMAKKYSAFSGRETNKAIEKALNKKFIKNKALSDELIVWGNKLLGEDVFKGINQDKDKDKDKWKFICLDNEQIESDDFDEDEEIELDDDFEKQVEKSLKDKKGRDKRLKNAPKKPEKTQSTITIYKRNPDVVAAVLERAKGYCEECEEPAPFNRASDNSPYLEVHHKIQLAKGGDDTVENAIALCPNCHRKAHFG
jgi:predicted HNH restriction endonuclease